MMSANITPKGNPAVEPKTTTSDGQNQFTFNNGSLTITFKAKVTPSGMASKIAGKCFFEVPELDNVKADGVTDGKVRATLEDDNLKATVTYSSLPNNNSGFGSKTVKLSMDGNTPETVYLLTCGIFEVFFKRGEKDHPGGVTPNWYYYWMQAVGQTEAEASAEKYGGMTLLQGTSWTDFDDGSRQWVSWIGDNVTAVGPANTVTLWKASEPTRPAFTYTNAIDFFAHTVFHERQHRDNACNWWPNVTSRAQLESQRGTDDKDGPQVVDIYGKWSFGDHIPDRLEAGLGYARQWRVSVRNSRRATAWGYKPVEFFDDCEDYTLSQQRWPKPSEYGRVDWAEPGSQHGVTH